MAATYEETILRDFMVLYMDGATPDVDLLSVGIQRVLDVTMLHLAYTATATVGDRVLVIDQIDITKDRLIRSSASITVPEGVVTTLDLFAGQRTESDSLVVETNQGKIEEVTHARTGGHILEPVFVTGIVGVRIRDKENIDPLDVYDVALYGKLIRGTSRY